MTLQLIIHWKQIIYGETFESFMLWVRAHSQSTEFETTCLTENAVTWNKKTLIESRLPGCTHIYTCV